MSLRQDAFLREHCKWLDSLLDLLSISAKREKAKGSTHLTTFNVSFLCFPVIKPLEKTLKSFFFRLAGVAFGSDLGSSKWLCFREFSVKEPLIIVIKLLLLPTRRSSYGTDVSRPYLAVEVRQSVTVFALHRTRKGKRTGLLPP